MYKNTGAKITTIANIVAAIGMVLAVIMGIVAWIVIAGEYSGGFGFLAFLLISAVGCGMAWLSSLLLAGFGELISNTSEMLSVAKHNLTIAVNSSPGAIDYLATKKNNVTPTPDNTAFAHPIDNGDGSITCPRCEERQAIERTFCKVCKVAFK